MLNCEAQALTINPIKMQKQFKALNFRVGLMEKSCSRCHLILFYVIYSVNFSVKGFPVVQMNYNILSNLGTCHLITFTYLITMRTFSSIFTVEKFNVVTTQIVMLSHHPF